MKTNNLDDLFKKKKTSNTLFYLKIVIVIFAFLMPLGTIYYMGKVDNNTYEIETNGKQYGKSDFFEYQGKVYSFGLSGDMEVLKNVDIATFKALEIRDSHIRNIGLDRKFVYLRNIVIPDLNPNKLKVIGNGYYTDGTTSYFLSPFSEFDKKSSNYIYPYKKIENTKNLKALDNFELFAVDGDNVYYKGEILNNADLNTLEIIDKNAEYFADKENVYYKSNLLPIKNSGKLKIVSSEHGDKFLYDEVNGYVFIGDYSFDRKKAPYKIIGSNGTHLYSLIFVSDDGIYFYDSENKKQVKLKDNIFIGNIEEISPNVFIDDENMYYFQNYEIWKKYRNMVFLASRNTGVYSLGKKESWKKLADVGNENIGSIWQKDSEYYYFDNLENSSQTDDYRATIFKITDKKTLENLLSYPEFISAEKIDEFILNKNFEEFKGEKLFIATIKFHSVFKIFLGFLLVLGFIFIVFFLYLKKLDKEDKKNIDKMLLEKYRNIKPLSKDYNNKE